MFKRRRFKQITTLEDRLAAWAKGILNQAEKLQPIEISNGVNQNSIALGETSTQISKLEKFYARIGCICRGMQDNQHTNVVVTAFANQFRKGAMIIEGVIELNDQNADPGFAATFVNFIVGSIFLGKPPAANHACAIR